MRERDKRLYHPSMTRLTTEKPAVPTFFTLYIACWSAFCLTAVGIMATERRRLLPEWRDYLRFLAVPWKLCVFAPAFLFVTFAGRYTNDETWDVTTGAGMSLLTFLTAPWAVGLFYQIAMGRRPLRYMIVAAALLLFSSSWFYDGYLLWRDGSYTVRWWSNLMLSPIIYVAAGLLWNLEAAEDGSFEDGARARFSFVRPDWPKRGGNAGLAALLPLALPLAVVAAYVLVGFVRWKLP